MEFRPCIDIHNGKVKQIVGGSIADEGDFAVDNFVSELGAKDYAYLYKKKHIKGGHIILLNSQDSEYYEADLEQAKQALAEYPGGLQIGGGITDENAAKMIELGASHVIVTSYVFADGEIKYERLARLREAVGPQHIVLDLSCRKRGNDYYIVTNRWQTFTKEKLSKGLFEELSEYCDEYLVHAVDVEGKKSGLDLELVDLLESCNKKPMTYAGGISSFEDLEALKLHGKNHVNFTVGSALDLFGGELKFQEIVTKYCEK